MHILLLKTATWGIARLAKMARAGAAIAFVIGMSIAAQPPIVSNVRNDYTPGPGGIIPHSWMRVRWNINSAACNHRINFGLTSSYGESNTAASCPGFLNDLGFPLTGLKPGQTYFYQPQSSFDGSTWSTGNQSSFTTPALPAIHPALPAVTGLWTPVTPSASGLTLYTMSNDCTVDTISGKTWQQVNQAVIVNQPTQGSWVQMADETTATAPCPTPYFPDDTQKIVVPENSSNINLTTGVFTVGTPVSGWTIANGQTVMMLSGGGHLPGSLSQGNDSNSYNSGAESGTQGPLISNVVYYLVGVSGSTFQLATIFGGSPITGIGDYGDGGNMYLAQYPPMNSNPIVFSTVTPDSQFAPPGVRADPAVWQSKMAKIQVQSGCNFNCVPGNPFTSSSQVNFGWFDHNITFRGVEWVAAPMTVTTVDPEPTGTLIYAAEGFGLSNIVFDRSWIHCGPYPNRCSNGLNNFAGGYMAVINSSVTETDYWIPSATPAAWNGNALGSQGWSATLSGQTLTIIPGKAILGPVNTCTSTANVTFTLTGGSASGTSYVYISNLCVPTLVMPTGMTGTCTGSMTDSASASHACSVLTSGSPGYLLSGGAYNCYTLGTFTITTGTPSAWGQNQVSLTAYLPQCCVTALSFGQGPGPYTFNNNFWEGTGIPLFAEDGTISDPVHISIKQNHFYWDQVKLLGSPTSDLLYWGVRNGPEFKHGREAAIIGNIFDGAWADVSATGPALLLHVAYDNNTTGTNGGCTLSAGVCTAASIQPGYGLQDIDVLSNSFINVSNCIEWGTGSFILSPFSVGTRLRFKNNFCNTNGFTQTAGNTGQGGNGGANGKAIEIDGSFEDMRYEHNTFYDNRGSSPVIIHYQITGWSEGFLFRDNFAWFNSIATGFNSETTPATLSPAISGVGSSFFNSAFTQDPLTGAPGAGGQMDHNVAVAYYSTFSPPNNPTGLLSPLSICTGFGGGSLAASPSYSCTGATPLFQIVLNQSTAPLNLAQINFNNAPANDFQLNYLSPFVSGSHLSSDGTDIGVDWNELKKQQGWVNTPQILSIGTTSATISWWSYDGSTACPVDYAVYPNDPNTQTGGGRITPSGGNSQSVNLTGIAAHSVVNYRVLCPVSQPTGSFKLQ